MLTESGGKDMDNPNKPNSTVGGVGFLGMLGITFIVLKLCGVIHWSWIWVLAPIWGGWVIMLVILLILYIWWNKG